MEHAFSPQCSGTLLENVGQQNPGTNVPKQSSAYKGFAIGYGVFCGGFSSFYVLQGSFRGYFALCLVFGVPWGTRSGPRQKMTSKRYPRACKAPRFGRCFSAWEAFFSLCFLSFFLNALLRHFVYFGMHFVVMLGACWGTVGPAKTVFSCR